MAAVSHNELPREVRAEARAWRSWAPAMRGASEEQHARESDVLGSDCLKGAMPARPQWASLLASFRRPARQVPGLPEADAKVPGFPGLRPSIWAACQDARQQLDQLLQEVAAHYGVDYCAVALHGAAGALLLAKRGLDLQTVPKKPDAHGFATFSFFRHHIRRDLPIIVGDAAADARLHNDPLVTGAPHLRFYAAAPLTTEPGVYTGTLSIASKSPRVDFTLEDAEWLTKVSAKVVRLVKPSTWAGGGVPQEPAKN